VVTSQQSLGGEAVTRDLVSPAGSELFAQSSGPSSRNDRGDGSIFLDLGKGPRSRIDSGSGAGSNPLAVVSIFIQKAPAPEIDAVAAFVPPAANQRLQFAGHGGDDGHPFHAGV